MVPNKSKYHLDAESRAWLEANANKLPKSKGRGNRLTYLGSLNDLTETVDRRQDRVQGVNPRAGSEVYVRDNFIIQTAQTKLSELPGAPTMPIKQWIRYRATRPTV